MLSLAYHPITSGRDRADRSALPLLGAPAVAVGLFLAIPLLVPLLAPLLVMLGRGAAPGGPAPVGDLTPTTAPIVTTVPSAAPPPAELTLQVTGRTWLCVLRPAATSTPSDYDTWEATFVGMADAGAAYPLTREGYYVRIGDAAMTQLIIDGTVAPPFASGPIHVLGLDPTRPEIVGPDDTTLRLPQPCS